MDLSLIIKYLGAAMMLFGVIVGTKAVVQMNRHISALPSPKKGSVLLCTGVYGVIRHPMYSALSLAAVGYGLFDSDLYKIVLSLLLLLFFEVKSQYEETRLLIFFPDYKDYKSRTGKFFPLIYQPKLNK